MEVPSAVPEYLLAEVQHICVEWRFLIENCKRFLSIAVRLVLPPRLLAKANQMVATESRSVK